MIPATPQPKTKSRRRVPFSDYILPIAFVLPAVILVGVLMYYPMGLAFEESLYTTSFLSSTPEFIGFEQYREFFDGFFDFSEPNDFRRIVVNSLVWTFGVVFFQNVVGMAAALLLNADVPGKGITRAIILLPWVLPGIVAALLWRFMYDPQLGLVNSIFLSLGLIDERVSWLADPNLAMMSVMIAAIWKGFPFSTVIYLAALQNVDEDQIEAAQIDGANAVQRFFRIILPDIAGIVRLNLLLTTIFTFNYFDMIWVTTGGGPLNSTHIFPTIIFETGFGEFRFGEAAAYGVMSVLILSVFAILYIREVRPNRS